MEIQIIKAEDFAEVSEKQDVFAEIIDVDTGKELNFLVRYFFIQEGDIYYKTKKFTMGGDSDIEEIVVLHDEDRFALAGKPKNGGYRKFSEKFSTTVYDMIISYFPNKEVFIAENRG